MSIETQSLALIGAGFLGVVAVGWFINWLVSVPHNEIRSDFNDLKERNER